MQNNIYKISGIFIFLILLLTSPLRVEGQRFPEPMKPARLVNDYMKVMDQEQQSALEEKLENFEYESAVQIAVVTLNDISGMDIADYAAHLFDYWGIGRGKENSGILILVKTKTPQSLGQVFIATGYGVEGAVPDILAGRIVDYDILPAFREGDYYTGLDQAVNTLIGLTRGEFTAEEYIDQHETTAKDIFSGLFVVVLIIIFLLFRNQRKNKQGYTVTHSGGSSIPPIIMGGGLGRGRSSGGFGGFGGGRTGGGGAGGSW